uniref:LSDAT_euk domain-containing protein n=1 Tax=Strongyloides stercoralis TaxID=6248 RepID=A0A0K0E7T5_STRER
MNDYNIDIHYGITNNIVTTSSKRKSLNLETIAVEVESSGFSGSSLTTINSDYFGGGNNNLIQLCPALILRSDDQLPNAVKHIYSKLAQSAKEVDDGIPNIIFSMISTGNHLSNEFLNKLKNGFNQVINKCPLWFILSGEQSDPLSLVTSKSIQDKLRNADKIQEILTIIIQNTSIIHGRSLSSSSYINDSSLYNNDKRMIDSKFNTLYLLLSTKKQEISHFRALAGVKLSKPPPAILITVPDIPGHTGGVLLHQQPKGCNEIIPTEIVIFAGASLSSLEELEIYAEYGMCCLVIQDSSELCAIIHTAWLMYHSSTFNFEQFEKWIVSELHSLLSYKPYNDLDIKKAKVIIFKLLAFSSGENSILSFITINSISTEFSTKILESLLQSAVNFEDVQKVVLLAIKLDSISTLESLHLDPSYLRDYNEQVFYEILTNSNKTNVLSCLMDQGIFPIGTPSLLFKLLDLNSNTQESLFFQQIIIKKLFRSRLKPHTFTSNFASSMNMLFQALSSSHFTTLFNINMDNNTNISSSLQNISLLMVLLNKPEIVITLVSYSTYPIHLSLIISKIAKMLTKQCSERFPLHYSNLLTLSENLETLSCSLLEKLIETSREDAYKCLCETVSRYGDLTLCEIALSCQSNKFLTNPLSKLWIERFFNGSFSTKPIFTWLPNYLKILIAFFSPPTIPIFFEPILNLNHDYTTILSDNQLNNNVTSPTVGLLDGDKLSLASKHSTNAILRPYSMHSNSSQRSSSVFIKRNTTQSIKKYSLEECLIDEYNANMSTPETPNINNPGIYFPPEIDKRMRDRKHSTESNASRRSTRTIRSVGGSRRRNINDKSNRSIDDIEIFNSSDTRGIGDEFLIKELRPLKLKEFYSTPIVKLEIRLFFDFIFCLLAFYSIGLPSCGKYIFKFIIGLWSSSYIIENIYLLSMRKTYLLQNGNTFKLLSTILLLIIFLSITSLEVIHYLYPKWRTRIITPYNIRFFWVILVLLHIISNILTNSIFLRLYKLKLYQKVLFGVFALSIYLSIFLYCIQILIYPDLSLSLSTAFKHLKSLATFQFHEIFTLSEFCKKIIMPSKELSRRPFCMFVNENRSVSCPTNLPHPFLFFLFFFIALPLLIYIYIKLNYLHHTYPSILFKSLLDLQTLFKIPPPFTIFNLIIYIYYFIKACINYIFYKKPQNLSKSTSCTFANHADVTYIASPTTTTDIDVKRKESILINPLLQGVTLPQPETGNYLSNTVSKLSINYWKSKNYPSSRGSKRFSPSTLNEKIKILLSQWTFTPTSQGSDSKESGLEEFVYYSKEHNIKKFKLQQKYRSWLYLMPHYHPPNYSKPKEMFPAELQCFVDSPSGVNLIEIGRNIKNQRINDIFSSTPSFIYSSSQLNDKNQEWKYYFSSIGIPLNPSGRTGISGRGFHPKFGINYKAFYCIFKINPDDGKVYILFEAPTKENNLYHLPNSDRYDTVSKSDVFLVKILTQLNVPVRYIQIMCSKSHLMVGHVENKTAHVLTEPSPQDIDTDNAWTEADVWALNISDHYKLLKEDDAYKWYYLNPSISNNILTMTPHSRFIKYSMELLNIE